MSSFNFTETTQSTFFMHKRKLNLSSLMTHKIQTRVSMATQYSMNVCFVYQFTGFTQVIPHNDSVLSFCCHSHTFSIYFVSTIPSFPFATILSLPSRFLFLSLLQSSDTFMMSYSTMCCHFERELLKQQLVLGGILVITTVAHSFPFFGLLSFR